MVAKPSWMSNQRCKTTPAPAARAVDHSATWRANALAVRVGVTPARVGPTHRRIPKLCQTSSGIVPRMRIPRTRFCRAPSLITICEAISPPGISKVAQNSPNPDRLS